MNAADLLQRAQAQGLLPANATWPATEQRPWPVQVLTAIGAWFAAVPLLAFIGVLLGPLVRDGAGLVLVGAALIAVAVLLLRDRAMPLFIEQLTVPVLLVGLLCVGWSLHENLPDTPAWLLMAALCLGLTLPLPRPWLRGLLGAAAAVCVWLVTRPWAGVGAWGAPALPQWAVATGLLAVWVGLHHAPWPARWAQAWEATGAGWLLALMAALAFHSGSPWLVAGLSGLHSGHTTWGAPVLAMGSAGTAVLGAALLVRAWPALRAPRWLMLAGLLASLALVLPALGPIALAAALCAQQQRWRLAIAAGLAALWVLGAFYYQVAWPLAHKALGLMALGLLVAAVARPSWLSASAGAAAPRAVGRAWAWGALVALGLTLAVANSGIAQKERLIAQGEPLFVALAPADPRSLMQGDFMRLNFAVPLRNEVPARNWGATRPKLVFQRDAQGLARYVRPDDGSPLAADERRVELSPKEGRWILVTDAWFFREGEAERWQAARFGEFRVTPDGRALLVGLRGEGLKPL
jgi:uncharacterized membrane-anchored protein